MSQSRDKSSENERGCGCCVDTANVCHQRHAGLYLECPPDHDTIVGTSSLGSEHLGLFLLSDPHQVSLPKHLDSSAWT